MLGTPNAITCRRSSLKGLLHIWWIPWGQMFSKCLPTCRVCSYSLYSTYPYHQLGDKLVSCSLQLSEPNAGMVSVYLRLLAWELGAWLQQFCLYFPGFGFSFEFNEFFLWQVLGTLHLVKSWHASELLGYHAPLFLFLVYFWIMFCSSIFMNHLSGLGISLHGLTESRSVWWFSSTCKVSFSSFFVVNLCLVVVLS